MGSKKRRRENPAQRRVPVGAAPGVLIPDPSARPTEIRVMAYGSEGCVESKVADAQTLERLRASWPVVWVDVVGLKDIARLTQVGEQFGLHVLALEDVVNPHQRPKVEEFGERVFLVLRAPSGENSTLQASASQEGEDFVSVHVATEQLCLFVGPGFVVSFQEDPYDCFDAVRKRIREKEAGMLSRGPDYLMYCLLDAVVDAYFAPLESVGERLDNIEDRILAQPDRHTMAWVYAIKRDLLTLRRAIWPMREAVNSLLRDTSALVTDEVRPYLRDCYDHVVRLMEITELSREVCSDLMDLYVSSVSNKLNEVMKVLTIIATLFIPLTFVTGIYGMNFNTERSPWNMPELNWPYGYPFALGLMATIVCFMVGFFWKRGWIGSERHRTETREGSG